MSCIKLPSSIASRCLPGVILLIALMTAGNLAAQSDDFNDGDADGWFPYNPILVGSFNVTSNAYRLRTAPSPAPTTVGPGRAGATRPNIYTDFYISVDIVDWDDSLAQAFGILARLSHVGAGTTRGYAFTYARGTTATSGDMDFSRITNEAPVGIAVPAGQDVIHLVPGNDYRFVFLGKGPNLEGRVYQLPNVDTPLVRMTAVNDVYTSGTNGLVVYDASSGGAGRTDATFDNYFAAELEPAYLEIKRGPFGEMLVEWRTNAGPFRLQSTASLNTNPIPWMDVPLGSIFPDGQKFQYSEDPTDPMKFFRLISD